MFKKIDDALKWIMASKKGEMSFKEFKEICNKLGNPQNGLKIIHVAGTNGKGSTVTFLRDLLMSQCFKVGTLQSPHYLTHLDRIRLNGKNIDDKSFLDILNSYYDFFVSNHLGMFEMDYLIMLEYFKREKVDFIITEVGIGGRLDSTNVVDDTILSIITNIGLDHTELLGDTLEKICVEKAEIIKPRSIALVGYIEDNLKEIVKKKCEETGSAYKEAKPYKVLGNRQFEYDNQKYELSSYATYQIKNASLALEAFRILSDKYGFKINQDKAYDAIKNSMWAGRFEIISEKPRIILDGAHNMNGCEALVESFDKLAGSKCIIFSALKRKDYKNMLNLLIKHCDKLTVTSFDNAGVIDLNDIDYEYKESDCLKAISDASKQYDNVLVCGSLYFISEVAIRKGDLLK